MPGGPATLRDGSNSSVTALHYARAQPGTAEAVADWLETLEPPEPTSARPDAPPTNLVNSAQVPLAARAVNGPLPSPD